MSFALENTTPAPWAWPAVGGHATATRELRGDGAARRRARDRERKRRSPAFWRRSTRRSQSPTRPTFPNRALAPLTLPHTCRLTCACGSRRHACAPATPGYQTCAPSRPSRWRSDPRSSPRRPARRRRACPRRCCGCTARQGAARWRRRVPSTPPVQGLGSGSGVRVRA